MYGIYKMFSVCCMSLWTLIKGMGLTGWPFQPDFLAQLSQSNQLDRILLFYADRTTKPIACLQDGPRFAL